MFYKSSIIPFYIVNTVLPAIEKKRVKFGLLFTLLFFVQFTNIFSQVVTLSNKNQSSIVASVMEEWVDTAGVSLPEQVININKFVKTNGEIPIYPNHIKSTWYKFTVKNTSSSAALFLDIAYSNLSRVSLYKITDQQISFIGNDGNELFSIPTIAGSPNIIFGLQLPIGSTQQYLLHVFSEHPIILPATIHTYDAMYESINLQTIIMGLYLGVLIVMFLYNLFLFIATKDNSYFFYILYIFFLALAQTTLVGYEYRFVWPHYPALNKYAVIFTSSFSAIAGMLFSMNFLRTALYAKKIHKCLQGVILIYVIGLVFNLFSNLDISYYILNYNGLLGVVLVLGSSLYIAKKHFRPAYFYLTAWLFFLVSFIILILRNLAVLPYNNFTTYIIYAGSSMEIALLSIALADKINVLRKEKEDSQAQSLEQLQINEKLVRDQNVMLEKKVTERTEELQSSNNSLGAALQDLKDTQIQLVEAEKMASLGQLTAGIAHEINNPINFVKSNIKPLQLDINDLLEVIDEYDTLHTIDASEISGKLSSIEKLKKKIDIDYVKNEIESLVKGIQDGAERTAEIVLGLRNFSRY
jgi:two-component system, NtrC family, sensor kinase